MNRTPGSLLGTLAAALILAMGAGAAVAGGLQDTSSERFADSDFTDNSKYITNPWWTLTYGDTYLYHAEGEDGCEWNLMEVKSSYTHSFDLPYNGIKTRIILDRAWLDEDCDYEPTADGFADFMDEVDPDPEESTYDWYAQDEDENIWYMGEDTYNGEDKEGSFVAGCDGAEAGIVMLGDPESGDFYQQEYYEDEAEDWGKVKNFIPADDDVCMKTKEWTPLETGHVEHKFYCSDGLSGELSLVHELKGKTVVVELIATDVPAPDQAVDGHIAPTPSCI